MTCAMSVPANGLISSPPGTSGATFSTVKSKSTVKTPPLPSSAVTVTVVAKSSTESNSQVHPPAFPESWVIVPSEAVMVTLSVRSRSPKLPLLVAVCPSSTVTSIAEVEIAGVSFEPSTVTATICSSYAPPPLSV